MEAVGLLAGGIAHDFNNLLTVISGYCDMLLNRETNPENVRCINAIAGASDRAAALTRQLLAFSRRQVIQPRVVNLNQVLSSLSEILERLIGEDVELALELDPALGNIKSDVGQLEQVLMNLSVNSRDAMPDGGRITISTSNIKLNAEDVEGCPNLKPGRYVRVSFTDTGVGMDQAIQHRIFEPFFTTKGPGRGTGLGLSTVYGIVNQNNGRINVASAPGRGTTFYIDLPRVELPALLQEVLIGPKSTALLEGTVLLVEDDPVLRELAKEVLEKSGLNVFAAGDGLDALKVFAQLEGSIDLLVTDIVMPRSNGLTLATKLRELRPHLKVLFTTGYPEHTLLDNKLFMNSSLLRKPFRRTELVDKVRDVIGSPC